jgi:hypothetical protein
MARDIGRPDASVNGASKSKSSSSSGLPAVSCHASINASLINFCFQSVLIEAFTNADDCA